MLFRFAVGIGHLDNNTFDTWMRREAGGRRSVKWLRDGERERVLNDEEIARLWTASAGLDFPARAFVRILMLTACRSGEISGLGWREVERGPVAEAAVSISAIRLAPPRTKNKGGHRVPVGPLAAAELLALATTNGDAPPTTGLVFPGVASSVGGICRALRKATGLEDWTWRDLRRSAATGMARLGCPREHVEAALNHISARGGLHGIYQRYNFQREAGETLLKWQEHIGGLVPSAPSQPAPALIIRTRRAANIIGLPQRRRGSDARNVA